MKDNNKLRSRIIVSRVTEQEFHAILKAAARLDMSLSDFVRRGALIFVLNEHDKN